MPRPNTATAVKWRTTFKQLNMSMDGLTKKDLTTPLLDLSIPGFSEQEDEAEEEEEESHEGEGRQAGEEGEQSPMYRLKNSSAYDRRSSVEILEDEEAVEEDGRPLQSGVETSVPSGSRPSSSYSQQRPVSRSASRTGAPKGRPSTSAAKRPSSQPGGFRSRSVSRSITQPRASTAKQLRSPSMSLPPSKIIDVPVHKGRPIDFSRALMGAYMGAASNDSVRAMLNKTRAWDK